MNRTVKVISRPMNSTFDRTPRRPRAGSVAARAAVPARATPTGPATRSSGAWAISIVLVVDEPVAEPELDERDDPDDHEQHPGERRGVAHPERLERLAEDVDDVEQGRVTAGRALPLSEEDRVDLREQLERRDGVDDDREEKRAADERQSDAPEPLPAARAIDMGGLVELGRDVPERREQDDDGAADAPQHHQDDAVLDPRWVVQP